MIRFLSFCFGVFLGELLINYFTVTHIGLGLAIGLPMGYIGKSLADFMSGYTIN